MSLHLFLAHADTRAPVLADRLPPDSAHEPPRPQRTPPPPPVPPPRPPPPPPPPRACCKRLLPLFPPLTTPRRARQPADVIVYEVEPCMDPEQANLWIARHY